MLPLPRAFPLPFQIQIGHLLYLLRSMVFLKVKGPAAPLPLLDLFRIEALPQSLSRPVERPASGSFEFFLRGLLAFYVFQLLCLASGFRLFLTLQPQLLLFGGALSCLQALSAFGFSLIFFQQSLALPLLVLMGSQACHVFPSFG